MDAKGFPDAQFVGGFLEGIGPESRRGCVNLISLNNHGGSADKYQQNGSPYDAALFGFVRYQVEEDRNEQTESE
jgi:hypothetical protein